MNTTWSLKTFPIADLKELNKNPRRLTKEQHSNLKESVNKFGLIDKPVVTHDGIIIGGHQRVRIMQSLGENHLECYVSDKELSDKDVEELNIRLNKNTGEWDFDLLANEWEVDELLDWGFSEKDLSIDADSILEEATKEDKPMKCIVTMTFENIDDLKQAEDHIEDIVSKYDNASYKVKIK